MNKIVREHYPAAKLPEELRQGLNPEATVTIVIEEEGQAKPSPLGSIALGDLPFREPGPPLSVEEMLESIRSLQATRPPLSDPDEPVRRIRALRDEWDDE